MRNKSKIIAILLISIMVTALIISCDDPTANLSNPELFEIAEEGMVLAMIAYMHQEGMDIEEFDFDDFPIPAEGTSKTIASIDLFTILSESGLSQDDDEIVAETGLSKGQAILRSGSINVTATKFEIKASVKFNNYYDLPNGTFNIVVTQIEGKQPTLTVNNKVVTVTN